MEDCFGGERQIQFEEAAENTRFKNAVFEGCRQLMKINRNEFDVKHVNYMLFNYIMLYYFNIVFCDFNIVGDSDISNSQFNLSHLSLHFEIIIEYYLLETCRSLFNNETVILKYDSLNDVVKKIKKMDTGEGYIFTNLNSLSKKTILVDNTYSGCVYNHALILKNVLHMNIEFLKYCRSDNDMLNYRKIMYHPVYLEDKRESYVKGICYNIANGGNNGYDLITPHIIGKGIAPSGTFKLKLEPLFNNDFFDLRNYPNLFLLRSRFVKKNLEILANESSNNELIICNRSQNYVSFDDEDRLVQILLPQTYDTLFKFRSSFTQEFNSISDFNGEEYLFNLYCIAAYTRVIKLFLDIEKIFISPDIYSKFLRELVTNSDKRHVFEAHSKIDIYWFKIDIKSVKLNNNYKGVLNSFDQINRLNLVFKFYREYEDEPFFCIKFQHHAKEVKK